MRHIIALTMLALTLHTQADPFYVDYNGDPTATALSKGSWPDVITSHADTITTLTDGSIYVLSVHTRLMSTTPDPTIVTSIVLDHKTHVDGHTHTRKIIHTLWWSTLENYQNSLKTNWDLIRKGVKANTLQRK